MLMPWNSLNPNLPKFWTQFSENKDIKMLVHMVLIYDSNAKWILEKHERAKELTNPVEYFLAFFWRDFFQYASLSLRFLADPSLWSCAQENQCFSLIMCRKLWWAVHRMDFKSLGSQRCGKSISSVKTYKRWIENEKSITLGGTFFLPAKLLLPHMLQPLKTCCQSADHLKKSMVLCKFQQRGSLQKV